MDGLAKAGEGSVIADADAATSDQDGGPRYLQRREDIEQAQLTPVQWALVQRLRQQWRCDPRRAEAEGAGLPAELRLYTAGAVAFDCSDHGVASAYFQRVLDLPAAQRRLRSTWAAYSLGRAQAALALPEGQPATTTRRSAVESARALDAAAASAREAFRLSRRLSIEGFSDPLELGIASLGEEARLHKRDGDWAGAIRLYASQHAQGSQTGYVSLRFVAAELAGLPEQQLSPLLAQAEVSRLLTIRLLSRIHYDYETVQSETDRRLIRMLVEHGRLDSRDADQLAALSYRQGLYDDARALLEKAGDGGLAWWLRAKLALRTGDAAAATAAYARAAKAFPAQESWGRQANRGSGYEDVAPHYRIDGERAILALNRGDYVDAFDLLYRSGDRYWHDAAEVAERVLTLEELQAYVDAGVPALAERELPARDSIQSREWPVSVRLRELLGRRLLRNGRWRDAPAYFARAELRQVAHDYAQARKQAESRWTRVGQAEAYYRAGRLARLHGMELLGSEMAPDYMLYGGNYTLGEVHAAPGPWLSRDEAARQLRQQVQPDRRFHYRYLAVTLAEQAADRLPASSQAFAAVLCKGYAWNEMQDFANAQRLYRRYVAEGARVPWIFGRDCPEPDFDGARKRLWTERGQALLRWKMELMVATVLSLGVAGWWWRRRRIRPVAG